MNKQAKITAMLLVLALVASASARVITVEVEGVVTHISTGGGFALDGSVGLGSTMTGFCTYDTDTPDLDYDPDRGVYALTSLSMTIGNYTFTHDPTSPDFPFFLVGALYHGYIVKSDAPRFDGTIYVDGSPQTYDDITWGYTELAPMNLFTSSSEYITTDALPDLDSWPDFSIFDDGLKFSSTRFYDNGDGYFGIFGEVTSLTVVPEPATITVDDDGPADFNTIQAAIDVAWPGDTVLVADGTYTGPGNRDIDFLGKAITVRSESGPENCIIDCNGTEIDPHRGFYFHNNENHNAVVEGFTITNGNAYFGGGIACAFNSSPTISNCTISSNLAKYVGGGIYCWGRSSPEITNCIITGNSTKANWGSSGGGISCQGGSPKITHCTITRNSADHGGGILCEWSNPTVSNCTITGNSADDGGGIDCYYSNPTITNCTISGNSSNSIGGGINCGHESNPTITNCIISGNSAEWAGGGIYCEGANPTIINCTITGNSAYDDGGGIYCGDSNPTILNCTFAENSALNGNALACDFWYPYPSSVQLTNCILRDSGDEIWNNDDSNIAITYSNIQGGWPGIGNINADPCFVEPGYRDANDTPDDVNDDFWVEGDYYLLPDSPCIDAGDPNYIAEPNETDLDGNPRVINGRIDMGAYETNYIQAAMKLTPQTLNCNSKGKYVKAHFVLPEGFLPEDVDVNESAIAEPMGIESEYIKVLGAGTGLVKLEITFDRETFCAQITETGEVEITVIGSLTTSRYFYATDTIKIKPQHQRITYRYKKNQHNQRPPR